MINFDSRFIILLTLLLIIESLQIGQRYEIIDDFSQSFMIIPYHYTQTYNNDFKSIRSHNDCYQSSNGICKQGMKYFQQYFFMIQNAYIAYLSKYQLEMNYPEYRALTSKQRQQRISDASIKEQYRQDNPLADCQFPEMGFIDFRVGNSDGGIKLATYRHKCQQPKGILFIFHGLNAHIGQGAHVGKYFSERGYDVVGFDHRGFGDSEGEPGYIDSLDQHLEDSKKFVDAITDLYRENGLSLPLYALGLSMGGMTVYHLSYRYPDIFQGVILMAPALKHNLPGIVTPFTSLISKILPKSTRLLRPFPDRSNKNPIVVEYRKNDKKCFSQRASLSTMNMIVQSMANSAKTFEQYCCPFLVIQGGLDKLVNPQGAFELYDKSKTNQKDKKLLFYEEMWHGIWHQQQIQQILDQCHKWISERQQKWGEIAKIPAKKQEQSGIC